MPIVLPTPDEIARMDWHEREKAMQRARRTIRALRDAESLFDDRLERLWDTAATDWAESVRAEARRLLHLMPADPRAAEHRSVATEVSNARCA